MLSSDNKFLPAHEKSASQPSRIRTSFTDVHSVFAPPSAVYFVYIVFLNWFDKKHTADDNTSLLLCISAGARPGVTRDTSRCPEARTTSAVLPAVPATRWCKKTNKKMRRRLTAGNTSLFPNELCLRRRRRRLLLPQSPLFLHSTFYTND